MTSGAFAQEQPPEAEQAAVKHATGYKPSPFTKQLRAESQRKHGKRLQALQLLDLPEKFETPFQIPQQNQGNCGSCWDVSACRAISCAYVAAGMAKGDGSFVIAPDAVMWCYSTGGCGGDDASTVMRIMESDGLPIEKDFGPYVATGRGQCNKTAKRYGGKSDGFTWGYADADSNGRCDYSEFKAAVMAHGCVVVTVDAGGLVDGEEVSTYFGGRTNHQIVGIGWDDTKGDHGAILCSNQWGPWGFTHTPPNKDTGPQRGYCWLGVNSRGTIAACGSEEVLWCRVENPTPPTPPVPPVPPAPPVPPVPPAPVQPATVTFTIPAYSFLVPGSWYSQKVTIPAQAVTATVNTPKSAGCEDCEPAAPSVEQPTPRPAYVRPQQSAPRQVAPRRVQSGGCANGQCGAIRGGLFGWPGGGRRALGVR